MKKKKIFVTFLLTASLILTFPTFAMANSTEPESPIAQTKENIETEKVSIYFQVIKPNGEWATAGGNSSVIIKKGEQGSKTYTINSNDKKDVAINGTNEIYQYLGTWGDGKYDASSGKIKLDRATIFNEYKQDGQEEVTVYIKADYNIIKNYFLDINYIDNVAHGGGGDSHYNNKTTYTHTFRTPADTPAHYDFLYWENQETNEKYIANDTLTIEADSLEDDKTINIYATYDYQPSTRVIYHYKDGIKDTGEQWSDIDIYENQPEELYWFYEDENTPIEKGTIVSLPEKISAITEKQDYAEQIDVYAHYYTVTWQNEDGTILEIDENVPYKDMPSYDSNLPTKEANAQYTYSFLGWDKEIEEVTDNVIYTATYNQIINKYNIKFLNFDNTILQDENLEYGETPIYKQNIPTKNATAQYTYIFTEWTPKIVKVITDAAYVAQYREEINKYTITWVNYDNSELEVDTDIEYGTMPSYNGNTPTKKGNAQYSYQFTGWSPTIETVTSNAKYTAQYNEITNVYTVTWIDENGTVLEIDTDVPYGSQPSYDGTSPTKEEDSQYIYIFTGWDKELELVTEDIVYTAVYDKTEKVIPKEEEKEKEEVTPKPREPADEIPITEPTIETNPVKPEVTPVIIETPNESTPIITRTVTTTRQVTRIPRAAAATSNPADSRIILTTSPEDYAIEADPVEEVEEDLIPTASPTVVSYWALLNLLLALLTVFEILLLIICPIFKNKKKKDKEEEKEYKYNYHYIRRIVQILLSIFTVWVFCATEDITLPIRFIDKYTLLMIILAIITTIVAILCKRKKEEEELENEGE